MLKKLFGSKKESVDVQPNVGHIAEDGERPQTQSDAVKKKLQAKFEEARLKKLKIKRKEAKETQEYLRKKHGTDEDVRIAEDIRESLINARVKFLYQPIFNIHDKKPVFHEVFTHMIDQAGRATEPNSYLPIAGGFGLSTGLDEVVFTTLLAKQQDTGQNFAINLTGATLSKNEKFFEQLMNSIMETGVSPRTLLFELKFHDIDNDGLAIKFIKEAVEMKFRFVLDYVGGGAKVIKMIQKLGFSYIKVDSLQFLDFATNENVSQNLKDIVSTAQESGIKIIMERVESQEMYDFCKEIGFDYIQGYYTARPAESLQMKMVCEN